RTGSVVQYTRPEARNDLQPRNEWLIPPAAARIQAIPEPHRQRQIRRASHRHAKESRRRHADDGHGDAIHRDCLPDDGGIGTKAAPPESVADDRNGVARSIIVGGEETPEIRRKSKHAEIVARDKCAAGDSGVTVDDNVHPFEESSGEHSVERMATVPQALE